jgi:uncharacterized protein
MGAGKTTAIATISEIAPVLTEEINTDNTTFEKAFTTAALDYGEITLGDGEKLRLFGTPGQERFRHMWELLGKDALGLVLLVDNSRSDPIADLGVYLEAFYHLVAAGKAVVGVGRTESRKTPAIADYRTYLAGAGVMLPVLSVDVRRRADMLLLLHVLFHQIEAKSTQQR